MEEVRRTDDDELCGFVEQRSTGWAALTVFGAELGSHADRDTALDQVLTEALASLADRWMLRDGARGDEEVVCIQEANAEGVTVALGYYSLPGVPTRRIPRDDLQSGRWELRR